MRDRISAEQAPMSRGVDFPGMHGDERILLLKRRHWSVLSQHLVRLLFLAALPLIALVIFSYSNLNLELGVDSTGGIVLVLGLSAYWLLLWLLFFHDWLDYYLDALIVTNERIVRIEQKGLFHRTVADLTLERVQDIAVESKGILATFLRFGTLYIQSAAEQRHFTFTQIPNPEIVKAQILTFIHEGSSKTQSKPPSAGYPTATVFRGGTSSPSQNPTGTP